MSGGVDSSVVAGLLKSQGETVVGMTMQLWNQRRLPELASETATGRCCSIDDVYDARYVAQLVGIPYYVVNFEDAFEKSVVKPFVDDYLHGRTPIPCTLCNNFIKFDTFIEMAEGIGADKIATGHYARITQNPDTGRWELRRAVDPKSLGFRTTADLEPISGLIGQDRALRAIDFGARRATLRQAAAPQPDA